MLEPGVESSAWTSGPLVGARGEFGIIADLREGLGEWSSTHDPGAKDAKDGILLAVGDDAALLRPPKGRDLVWTCDIQLEERHFRREWMSPEEVGARAAEVSMSDVAAMGGWPMAVLVSLGLPADFHLGALQSIYRGMMAALNAYGARIVGGNISSAQEFFMDLSVLGWVERGEALTRSGARAGDQVYVTGQPGRAAAALALLSHEDVVGTDLDHYRSLIGAYRCPHAQIGVGRYLLENGCAGAAIDQSDGLPGDLHHIAQDSGVTIELQAESLPVSADLMSLGERLKVDPLQWVAGPSDDYGLIFTAPREAADRVLGLEKIAGGVGVHRIGQVVSGPSKVLIRDPAGNTTELGDGWDHFK